MMNPPSAPKIGIRSLTSATTSAGVIRYVEHVHPQLYELLPNGEVVVHEAVEQFFHELRVLIQVHENSAHAPEHLRTFEDCSRDPAHDRVGLSIPDDRSRKLTALPGQMLLLQ